MQPLTIKHPVFYATIDQWNSERMDIGDDQVIAPGDRVDYVAHVYGGMVKVRHNGEEVIIHPGATAELGE